MIEPGKSSEQSPPRNAKRDDYINGVEYFMAAAVLASMRSKDSCTQVGACIVNKDNKIVGIGYNGLPTGCDDDKFPWGKSANYSECKHPYVCHAELNAIMYRNASDVKDCTIYVSLFPCNECAKLIIQYGIKHVIYLSNNNFDKTQPSRILFDVAGVSCRQYTGKQDKIVIDFTDI